MRRWLFATPLRSGIFMFVTGVVFTAVTIGIGVSVDWDLSAAIGRRHIPGWFQIPGGFVLGIGSAVFGAVQLIGLVVRRVRPQKTIKSRLVDADGEPLDLP